jgi:multiple sugar transport system substrate-binding protein
MEDLRTRRGFLRLAAGAAAVAVGPGCGSGSDKPKATSTGKASGPAGGRRTLRIVLLSHFVPAHDAWFDKEYVARWGEEHDVSVLVDHIPFNEVSSRADAEVAARGPHDIFGFVDSPAIYEDETIDHRDVFEEISGRFGRAIPLVERCVVNPKTGKVWGCPHYWVANVAHYRIDLWNKMGAGSAPRTWQDLIQAAPRLKGLGYPLGIGFAQEGDSNYSLISLLHANGAFLQDEGGTLTINRPATVEAVKIGTDLFKAGLSDDVFAWDASSNNRSLLDGRASLIFNAVSAIRAMEIEKPDLAADVALAPMPTIPGRGPARAVYIVGVNVIWRFSENQDLAKQFLVDLAATQRDAFVRSGFYNLPPFEGAAAELAEFVARDAAPQPPAKYALLADAASWSTNIGHPGPANAACMEVFHRFLVPKMFADVARGEMSAEDGVRLAEAQIQPSISNSSANANIRGP